MKMPKWLTGLFESDAREQRWEAPYYELIPYLAPRTASGVSVTPEGSMRASAVYACVRIISESVASLPLHLYRRKDRMKERANDHPIYRLLHDQPNEWQTALEFREQIFTNTLLHGTGFGRIISNQRGRIESLELLPTAEIERAEMRNGVAWYLWRASNQEARWLGADELLILRGLAGNQFFGYSPIRLAATQAIGLSLAAEEYGATFFGNGARPGGILEHPGSLSEEAQHRLRMQWNDNHEGASNAHRLRVLEEGMQYKPVEVPPEEAQFLETRKFQVTEIARIFRVPPHMLADLDRATFSNIEHQSINFVVHTLRPWLVRFEQAIHRDLLTTAEKQQYFVKHSVEGLLRGDTKSRFDAYAIGIQNRILLPNEARDLEDLNPVEGGDEFVDMGQQFQMDDLSEQQAESDARQTNFDARLAEFKEKVEGIQQKQVGTNEILKQFGDFCTIFAERQAESDIGQTGIVDTLDKYQSGQEKITEILTQITNDLGNVHEKQEKTDDFLADLDARQIDAKNIQVRIAETLEKQREGQEQTTSILAQIVDTMGEIRQKQVENDEKFAKFQEFEDRQSATEQAQSKLASALSDLQIKTNNAHEVLDAVLEGMRNANGQGEFAALKSPREIRQDRLRAISRFVSLFEDATGRLTRREIAEIRQAIRVDLERDSNIDAFRDKLSTIYDGLRDVIPELFTRLMDTLADAIFGSIGDELGQGAPNPVGLATFIVEYLENFAASYTVGGEKQIRALLEEAEDIEQATELVSNRMDGWEENRASKTAIQQAFEAANAFSIVGYSAAGVREVIWDGGDCPLCRKLNGKRFPIDGYAVESGDTIEPDDDETTPLQIERSIRHGPLHGGCDCTLRAG